MEENTEKSTDKRLKNLKPAWKPGESGNVKGKRPGQRDYATIYREALIKFAKSKKKTPEEIEELFEQVGFMKALSGDARFYQDFRDRIHGKAIQRNEHTGANGKDLIPDAASKEKADNAIDSFLKKQNI